MGVSRSWLLAMALSCSTPPPDDVPSNGTVPDPPAPDDGPALDALSAELHPDFGSLPVVHWDQASEGQVHLEYLFEADVWQSTPVRPLGPGAHEELLLGVPYDTTVTVRAVLAPSDGPPFVSEEVVISTGPVPPDLPRILSFDSDPSGVDTLGMPFVFTSFAGPDGLSGDWWTVILDRQARVVWARKTPDMRVSLHPRVSRDGRSLLVDHNSFFGTYDGGLGSEVVQLGIDGEIRHTWPTPGLHHPYVDLPDGALAYGATEGPYDDETLDIVAADGARETVFVCSDWLLATGTDGYCMSNTLTWDEAADSFLFSMYSFESVLRIDRPTGEVTAVFGHLPGAWAFDPPESAFWWQHGAYLTASGTLLLSTDRTDQGVETVAREYEIDEGARTLREVWSFGVDQGVFGHQMGEALRLPNGNTLHNYGDLARLREVTPDGRVVWDALWLCDAIGRSMPITDLYALAPERP